MDILGTDSSDTDIVGDGDDHKLGDDKELAPERPPGTPGKEDRESQTPEISEKGLPRSRSSFGRYANQSNTLGGTIGKGAGSVGYPCTNCPHTHKDHSMYSPQHCLIDGCGCTRLAINHKVIPSRYE